MVGIDIREIAERALALCKERDWSLTWSGRGVYLHLEVSELIESLRGKGDTTPTSEAADVLFVLLTITESRGITDDMLREISTNPKYRPTRGSDGSC